MDQVRVVGLWGLADMGPGRHGDGPKRGQADAATQSRKFKNKSNKTRI